MPIPRRLPAILTRAELAWLVTPTYAEAMSVDDEEAHERLTRALAQPALVDDLLWGVAEALADARGPRTSEDAQLDKLSQALQTRRGRVGSAGGGNAVSAAMVRINLELGLASETLRATLEAGPGADLLDQGLRKLGARIAGDLLK